MLTRGLSRRFGTRGVLEEAKRGQEEAERRVATASRGVPLAFSSYQPKGAKGRPVVVSHGLLGSKSNWNTIAKALALRTKRKVVAVDLRNHGESPHTKEFSYGELSGDLGLLVGGLGKSAALLGHSLGGRASMLLALDRPQAVESLVVVDVSPTGQTPGLDRMRKILDLMAAVSFPTGVSLGEARSWADEQLEPKLRSPWFRKFLLTNVVQVGEGKFGWRLNLSSIRANLDGFVHLPARPGATYQGPTLFVAGAESDYIRKEEHSTIRKMFPRAEIEVVGGAGHMVHVEKPKELVGIVSRFLDKVGAEAGS